MSAEPVVRNRIDRRRERTRNALIGAARKFLSEGRSAVSIQEITDAADVGFGSFYNHFQSKEQLFDEAVRSARAKHPSRLSHTIRIGHRAAFHIGGLRQ